MKKYFFLCGILVSCAVTSMAGVQGQLRQAGKLYQDEKYGSALNIYQNILKQHPQNQRTLFNAGNAYYRLHEYTQAEESYKQAAAQSGTYGQSAQYNLGNTHYRAGNTEKAIEAYKKAILQNPQDKEAIHNLQLIIKEKQQKQNNQNNQNNQDNQSDQSDNQNQQDQQKNQGQDPQEQPPQQPKNGQLTQEEADRVMSMAKESEHKSNAAAEQAPEELVEKDW